MAEQFKSGNKKWVNFMIFWQTFMIVVYFAGTSYSKTFSLSYPKYQDIHVMIFIGFGFLMTYLKKYSFTSLGFNFVISAFTIEWAIILLGFWERVENPDDDDHDAKWGRNIRVSIDSLIDADFAAGAVLISFGALLGKVNLLQLTIMALLETFFYSLNFMLVGCEDGVCASDIGGSIVIHTFGAYFGLTVSSQLGGKSAIESSDCSSNKASDLFSILGTIFLWMFWPSFNSGPSSNEEETNRVIVNTVLSISASCLTAFIASSWFTNANKFQMVHVQNATLAGGVAIGAVSNMKVYPAGAIAIGSFAGAFSSFGFEIITPFLESKFGLHDTCGVNNLHGMPGILSGLLSILVAGIAKKDDYGDNFEIVFPKTKRSGGQRAGAQFLALLITLGVAIISGWFTACIMRLPSLDPPEKIFDDTVYWDFEHGFEHGHVFEQKPEPNKNERSQGEKKLRRLYSQISVSQISA